MNKQFNIENRNINLYYNKSNTRELPVIILNTYGNEGNEVYQKCSEIKCKEFILVAISNIDWNKDMTPWFAPKLNKSGEDFSGKADEYVKILQDKIIPEVENYIKNINIKIKYYVIAGYSLGGLFALYSAYRTDLFSKIVSASGSFWFPNFVDYVRENQISTNVEKIYFSLGNKESKVKNQVMATVEDNTKKIEDMLKSKGIETFYEENEGNHFRDATLRMEKGIKWVLN